ncbi:unnamed protein product [Closterium sp. NIES-65]|nr:unnamed protein product [Closterium sp. NIES-65]
MVKLFSRKIDQLAEGAGVGGGADHEGGGEKTGRVLIEYSVEEEEEIEEDTSRQAQHGASGPGGDANEDEDSSSGTSSGSSSSDESAEDDGEGAGHRTERTGEHGVALGERVDERVELIEQQATGETKAVEEQEGGAAAQEGGVGGQRQVVGEAAAQEGGAGGQQEEGVAAAQEGGAGVQQQAFRVAAARVGGSGGQEQEDWEAAEEYRRGDERQAAVTRSHRTASGSGQAGPSTWWPSTAGQSTVNVAPGGQVVELLQRVEKVEASQKQLVADVFAKHTEQAGVFNRLAADFRTAWNTISESSKSTLSQCAEAVKGVTAERNLLEGARAKIDEMSGKIIEGVAAAITKASEDAVEKQLKQVEERLVAAVLKGFEKAIMEDMFCSTLPPETMKELKDIVREGYHEAEAGRLEVLTEAMARGFQRSAGPSTRSRQEGVGGVRSGAEPRGHERSVPPSSSVGGHVGSPVGSPPARGRHPVAKPVEEVIVLDQSPRPKTSVAAPIDPPDAFASMRDMLQGMGKTGGKGVVAGEKSGAPKEHVASTGNRALGMRGASTPSGGGAGKGAGEARAGLLSKTKAASAAQGGGAGLAVGLAGNWTSSSTPPVAPVAAAPSLGNVSLSDPGSPSTSKKKPAATKSSKRAAHATESLDVVELASVPGQATVEKTSIVVAARQEKAKKARVTGHTPPPRPDDQGKTIGCKRPFKGPGFGLRKGKPVSEQTVGGRKRFLGTFETEKDQKFCTAVCWRVYFPDVVLTEYEGYTAQDEEDWKDYLDAAAEMPTGVWSVAQEQGECRFDDYLSLLATAKKEVKARTERGIALCVAIGKVATLGLKHGNLIYPVPKGMAATPHMMAIAATVASLWAASRKLSREDIKKDALAAANAAIYAPETAKKACVAAMSALVSILLHVGKTFPTKQWPDHLYSSAVEGLGSTDAILLQMLRVAAQVCTQWCCCRAAARLLEDAGYGSLAMPEEKSKAKQGDEDAAETETGGQGE